MKHLKTYENPKLSKLYKKYIIADFNPYYNTEDNDMISSGYYIFNVALNTTENRFYYNAFYYINKHNKKLIETKANSSYTNYKNKIFDILYQTNSFKDAINILSKTIDINKYNL
jgi:hypothetical protein